MDSVEAIRDSEDEISEATFEIMENPKNEADNESSPPTPDKDSSESIKKIEADILGKSADVVSKIGVTAGAECPLKSTDSKSESDESDESGNESQPAEGNHRSPTPIQSPVDGQPDQQRLNESNISFLWISIGVGFLVMILGISLQSGYIVLGSYLQQIPEEHGQTLMNFADEHSRERLTTEATHTQILNHLTDYHTKEARKLTEELEKIRADLRSNREELKAANLKREKDLNDVKARYEEKEQAFLTRINSLNQQLADLETYSQKCDLGWVYLDESNSCYRLHDFAFNNEKLIKFTWRSAEFTCNKVEANLASIHSEKEEKLIRKMIFTNITAQTMNLKVENRLICSDNYVWIGAHLVDLKLKWTDGSSMKYFWNKVRLEKQEQYFHIRNEAGCPEDETKYPYMTKLIDEESRFVCKKAAKF